LDIYDAQENVRVNNQQAATFQPVSLLYAARNFPYAADKTFKEYSVYSAGKPLALVPLRYAVFDVVAVSDIVEYTYAPTNTNAELTIAVGDNMIHLPR